MGFWPKDMTEEQGILQVRVCSRILSLFSLMLQHDWWSQDDSHDHAYKFFSTAFREWNTEAVK
jgi:hypothetical protein